MTNRTQKSNRRSRPSLFLLTKPSPHTAPGQVLHPPAQVQPVVQPPAQVQPVTQPPAQLPVQAKPVAQPQPTCSTSFADILNVPKAIRAPRKRKATGASFASVITSSPYKENLLTAKEKQPNKQQSKRQTKKNQPKKQQAKKQTSTGKRSKKTNKQNQTKSKRNGREEDKEEEDEICLVCVESFRESGGEAIQCGVCDKWAHVECAYVCGVSYICDFCS